MRDCYYNHNNIRRPDATSWLRRDIMMRPYCSKLLYHSLHKNSCAIHTSSANSWSSACPYMKSCSDDGGGLGARRNISSNESLSGAPFTTMVWFGGWPCNVIVICCVRDGVNHVALRSALVIWRLGGARRFRQTSICIPAWFRSMAIMTTTLTSPPEFDNHHPAPVTRCSSVSSE